MNCKFAPAGPRSLLPTVGKHTQSIKARIPQPVSFPSYVSKSRISINTQSGPRIVASYAGTAESLYEVLGIEESVSSLSDVKKAYKKMARKYHPDVSPADRVDENTRRFIMVKEAYETLSNPQRRALYDRKLAGGHDQEIEEKGDWKTTWQSQLDELKRRSNDVSRRGRGGRMSWGARMRTQS